MDVLIIASGGGHTGYARAIAQYLEEKVDFVVPEGDLLSRKLLEPYARKIFEVAKGREPSGGSLLLGVLRALTQSFQLPKYDATVATGSNHSVVPSLIERVKGSSIYAIESQDRIVTRGKAIHLISRFSRAVFLHWKEQLPLYKNGVVTGPIVEKPKYDARDEGYVLFTAGSMGFHRLFKKALALQVKGVVQTGRLSPDLYRSQRPDWNFFDYDIDLERWIAHASIVVTHQGKTAMEAVVMYRKPTVVVYNSDWTRAASREDTKIYAELLGAYFLEDPSKWKGDELNTALASVKEPKPIEPGTIKLVNYVLKRRLGSG
ncbi:polysaccharide biosynthesis protein [Sulfodiicoccus acidiphilus]|uniref:Polysaccharide biosynthesis protein n=1 Tax=Sulfodiicoccus acidiphilus TaxID=1670455 RepID=A0A348B0H2_9CREN|nr:polysaccharide biosynthesis protein [Sulfodiicoccus acidiphilus]BBD71674.1 polysaccharide biosynthesis protein [Sulfodiicoccus acidiphilus]GGT86691.1 polysaccharide biosynthesis protein [Sulfodiicoccus acidiphilus]